MMTSKMLFRISVSESLIGELYERVKEYSAYKADCIGHCTERLFEELPDEQLLNLLLSGSYRPHCMCQDKSIISPVKC